MKNQAKKPDIIGDDEEFDPINEPKIEREYTKGNVHVDEHQQGHIHIPEPELSDAGTSNNFGPDEDIDHGSGFDFNTGAGGGGRTSSIGGRGGRDPRQPKEPKNESLNDMSPASKRKAARETAAALLDAYCVIIPGAFSSISKFKTSRLNKLALEGKLNPFMPFGAAGTFSDHVRMHNAAIDRAFNVSEETREAIREPLEEVLLEQGLALTATQRLMLAVGQHLAGCTIQCISIIQSNKEAINFAMAANAGGETAENIRKYGMNPFGDETHSSFGASPTPNYHAAQQSQARSQSNNGSGTVSDVNYEERTEEKKYNAPVVDESSDASASISEYLKMDDFNDNPDPSITIVEE
jgi:hypothetical protein